MQRVGYSGLKFLSRMWLESDRRTSNFTKKCLQRRLGRSTLMDGCRRAKSHGVTLHSSCSARSHALQLAVAVNQTCNCNGYSQLSVFIAALSLRQKLAIIGSRENAVEHREAQTQKRAKGLGFRIL